jgi:hypothetical protein
MQEAERGICTTIGIIVNKNIKYQDAWRERIMFSINCILPQLEKMLYNASVYSCDACVWDRESRRGG